MDIATFEQIATVLSKLTVSYNNLLTEYYNLFYNPTPMDVTIQYYDEEGELSTIEIPNRAKDRRFILNGKGAPEDTISGSKGSIYQDLTNGEIYLKQAGSGISGWSKIISESELETVIKQGVGSPEGAYTAPKGVLYIDKQNASLYIKSTATSSEGWLLISANTNDLALRNLSNLTEEGESHFANPSLSNLDSRGRAILDGKENINNKITVLTEDCTDVQYPSAKLFYDVIVGTTLPLANRDLNNLTEIGEEHFLGKPQVGDGVLYAPNGVASASGNIISIPSGTILLLANGRQANGTLENLRVTTFNRTTQITGTNYDGYIFYSVSNTLISVRDVDYYSQSLQPLESSDSRPCVWYNPSINTYSLKSPGSTSWVTTPMARLAQFSVTTGGSITSFIARYPIRVATEDDMTLVHNDIDDIYKSLGIVVRQIGQPIIRLNDTILDDEIRLEGAEVSKVTYASLYAIYGDLYGTATEEGKFVLPDFRNRGFWGSTSLGYQEAELPNHSHTFSYYINSRVQLGNDNGVSYGWYPGANWSYIGAASASNGIYKDGARVVPDSVKVRIVTRYK